MFIISKWNPVTKKLRNPQANALYCKLFGTFFVEGSKVFNIIFAQCFHCLAELGQCGNKLNSRKVVNESLIVWAEYLKKVRKFFLQKFDVKIIEVCNGSLLFIVIFVH